MTLELAWQTFAAVAIKDCTKEDASLLRLTFLAGAATLYYVVMDSLSPGSEVTEEDLENMQLISEEIKQFTKSIDEEIAKLHQQRMN